MEKRRVVITGMGVVAPNGVGVENFWKSLVQGRSSVGRITHFDASSYPCQVAAEVLEFDPARYMDLKTAKRLSRFAQFALAASRMAVEDSEIDLTRTDPFRAGVVIGTGIGGGDSIENQFSIFMEKGIKRLSPLAAVMICTHSAAGIISCELKIKGSNTTVAAACNSGLDAIYLAYNSIRFGDADLMFAGAGEAPITPCNTAIFCANGTLAKTNGAFPEETLKPFDADARGTVLGEGGAIVVLEDLQHALERKAKIYGEIAGYASGSEAYDLFDIEPTGATATRVMTRAIENAGLESKDIDFISAHGNGLPKHDLIETLSIKKAFGELAYQIPVTSIKPITGQSFALTGVFQMMACLWVIREGIIPPTVNLVNPQPDCDLDYVPHRFRKKIVDTALMKARGFGGSHTSLVVTKFTTP